MLERLLVALDGSPVADRALALAVRLSRRYGSELVLCSAIDRAAAIAAACAPDGMYPSSQSIIDEYYDAAKSVLAEAASRAATAEVRATTTVIEGRPAAAVVACAKDRAVDAIVIGTRGARGLEHMFLGSTAEGVLRMSDVPVFVVPDTASNPGELDAPAFSRILVALDDSDASAAAQSFALALAAAGNSRLLYCNVVETGDLLDKAETFGYNPTPLLEEMHQIAAALIGARVQTASDRGVTADSVIVEGTPVNALLEAAAAHGADLIALGTHGRRGLRRLFLGSVAEHVVRRSLLPLLVVRMQAAEGDAAGTSDILP